MAGFLRHYYTLQTILCRADNANHCHIQLIIWSFMSLSTWYDGPFSTYTKTFSNWKIRWTIYLYFSVGPFVLLTFELHRSWAVYALHIPVIYSTPKIRFIVYFGFVWTVKQTDMFVERKRRTRVRPIDFCSHLIASKWMVDNQSLSVRLQTTTLLRSGTTARIG